MEDSKIVDLYLARDEKAIAFTSQKYGNRLRRLADRILNDASTAEECENDTYMHAWNSIPPHEPRDYFLPFLSKIIRFLALDNLKAMTRKCRNADFVELSAEIENCIPATDDIALLAEGKELSRLISDYLRTLPSEKRNIFLRRYWFMNSVAEVAERFGISEGKVKTVLFRVRKGLRDYLQKEGYPV